MLLQERQAESIIDKLCQRFRLTVDERQWRDIAFCLSLLPFRSERSLKMLIAGLPFYQDKLHEETVYKRFSEILAKVRGFVNLIAFSTLTIIADPHKQGFQIRDRHQRVPDCTFCSIL